jgi:hypothetical protein
MEQVVRPVSPEEVFLCVLAEMVVSPPEQDQDTGAPLNPGRIARQLSVLILKEIKSLDSPCYPSLTQLIATLRAKLPDAGAELVRGLATKLSQLESPDDVLNLFTGIGALLLPTGAAPPAGSREDGVGERRAVLRRVSALHRLPSSCDHRAAAVATCPTHLASTRRR